MAALFYEDEAYPTTVCAQKPSVIAFIGKDELCRLFREEPLLCENYITLLSKKIRFLNKKIETFCSRGTQSKLYSFLKEEYKKHGEDGKLTLPYNMQDLALVLGIGRTSLYRELDLLEEQNLITRKGKTFYFISEDI